jgi:3-phenylpropionate/cinnamic acid dioxygenase small subunit
MYMPSLKLGTSFNRIEGMGIELSFQDRLELHELASRYGNVVDARDWDGLSKVFTEDAVFHMEGFEDSQQVRGLESIRAMMKTSRHPVAHHVTNVEIRVEDVDVRLFFKVLGPGPRGRVGSADYRDLVRREADGWRIAVHNVTLRRPDSTG